MQEIFTRRSVRKFKNTPVSRETVVGLLKAGMQAPSARNRQPWEFLVIRDKDTLKSLSKMSPYSSLLVDAPVAIVLLADMNKSEDSEYWQQDMAACAQNILLEAVSAGLGTVWLGTAPREERMQAVAECVSLPDNLKPFCVIAAGYAADGEKHATSRFDESRIHWEKV